MTRLKPVSKQTQCLIALGIAAVCALQPIMLSTPVHADKFDEQIKSLEQKIQEQTNQKNQTSAEVTQSAQTVEQLAEQLAMIKASAANTTTQKLSVENEINSLQTNLSTSKDQLSTQLRELYIEQNSMSPLEMLATSKSLSQLLDREEYRNRIKDKVLATTEDIETRQKQLANKQTELNSLLAEQLQQQETVGTQKGTASQRLGLNQQQLAGLDGGISQKTTEIVSLRAAQASANSTLLSAAPEEPASSQSNTPTPSTNNSSQTVPTSTPTPDSNSSGSYPTHPQVLTTYSPGVSGGGYPTKWANAPQDSLVDSWGMYNRECVSYTAFKVAQSGRRMQYWGGRGNANQWPNNARSAGISVDSSPRANDVAIFTGGYYGHAMYVEAVYPNGLIKVSQYNYNLRGEYSLMIIANSSSLRFIHF